MSLRAASASVALLLIAVCTFTRASLVRNVAGDGTFTPGPFYDNVYPLQQNWTNRPSPEIVQTAHPITISTWFGAYPCLNCGPHRTAWCNGGIPQLANLTRHRELIARDIAYLVPDVGYTGMLVNDYENWHLGWDLTPEIYRNASRLLAKQLNPSASPAEIDSIAKSAYETAAVDFFVATLEAVLENRPNVSGVGFYGYPSTYTYWGNISVGAAVNDQLGRLWNVTTVFTPSLYLPYLSGADVPFARNKRYIDEQLAEVNRVRTLFGLQERVKILPYIWYRYHPGEPHAYQLYTPQDACLEYTSLFSPMSDIDGRCRVDGAIIWGDESTAADVAATKQWMADNAKWIGNGSLPDTTSCADVTSSTLVSTSEEGGHRTVHHQKVGSGEELLVLMPDGSIPPYTPCSL